MVLFANRPFLTEKDVEQVLQAMRSGSPLESTNPLLFFVGVQSRLESPHALRGDAARRMAVFDHLNEILINHLNSLRHENNSLSPHLLDSDAALQEAFSQPHSDLQALSVLYHRYLRPRPLAVRQIAELAQLYDRAINRLHAQGLQWLTEQLIIVEQQARQRETRLRLRLALPQSSPPVLFGVESIVQIAAHSLIDSELPHHVCLYGAAGRGKRGMALVLAHQLIERELLEDLLWVDLTNLPPFAVLDHIIERLGATGEGDPIRALRSYLLLHPTLIILDQASTLLADAPQAYRLLTQLDSARVIMISRIAPPERIWCYAIEISDFTRQQAFAFLEHLAQQRDESRDNWIDHFDDIWQAVGGNPQALKIAFNMVRSRFSARLMYNRIDEIDRLYQYIWPQLTTHQQWVWLLPLLFPDRTMPYDAISPLCGLEDLELDQALSSLCVQALLDAQYDQQRYRYSLLPLAATFLYEHIRRGAHLANGEQAIVYVRSALRHRIGQLTHTPDPDAALEILRMCRDLDFPDTELWEQTYALEPQITEAGLWSAWHQHLLILQEGEPNALQAARLNLMLGTALRWSGNLSQAHDHLRRALAFYTQESSPRQADVLCELAVVRRYQGELIEAQQLLQTALNSYTGFENPTGIDRCLNELSQLALESEEFELALAWLNRLSHWSTRSWGIAGLAYSRLHQEDAARRAAEQLHQAALLEDRVSRGRTIATLGHIYDNLSEPDVAASYFMLASEHLERAKDMLGYARACNNLAVAYLKQPPGRREISVEDVRRLLVQALRIQQHIGDEVGLAATEQNLAWLADLE